MQNEPPTPGATEQPDGGRRFALLSDEPLVDPAADQLGARRAAEHLSGLLLASRSATPFTLAVDAGWGMGKSSLMRLVEAELRAVGTVETVWYNAWTSTGADALEGLIKSVLLRFDRRILRRSLARVSEQRTLVRMLRSLLLLLAGPLGVAGLVDELWRSMNVDSAARNEMRDAIRELTEEWAQTPGEIDSRRMIVVFIDDLDRCSEETVLAVCEAVKIYLDVPRLAFVIGCDRSALGPNGLLRDLSPAGSAFMEKIFQTSYRIPAADSEGVKEYIRACARQASIDLELDEELIRLLAERSGRNPRRIKRLINGIVLEATLNPTWESFGYAAMVRTLLLQYFYGDFYRMMTGTLGGVDLQAVTEFRAYAQAVPDLRGPMPEPLPETLRLYLDRHGVPTAPAHWTSAAEELERQLPAVFPELAADHAFTSLIDELMALPDAAELVERLQEGVPVLLAGEIPSTHQLPDDTGDARPPGFVVDTILFVGAASSGKTMLLAFMMHALQSGASRRGYSVESIRSVDLHNQLRDGPSRLVELPSTHGQTINSLLLKAGQTERLLRLVDVPGEYYGLHHLSPTDWVVQARTFVFVLDVVRLQASRRGSGQTPSRGLSTPAVDQAEFFGRWVEEARGSGAALHRSRLAVVVSKADVLPDPALLNEHFGNSDRVEKWLAEELGMDGLTRAMAQNFGEIRYFFTSAVVPSREQVHPSVVALTDWCIG
ncbi:P-loop NTPase fold protein [Streptomyces sp. NPDC057620]|uniref:P-loop NTPase fold protein n=1 Tax=Streptomyces sp. NPDC057620 TaxID=3346185 RepID=UPI003683A50F